MVILLHFQIIGPNLLWVKLDRICNEIVVNVKPENKAFKYYLQIIYSENSARASQLSQQNRKAS